MKFLIVFLLVAGCNTSDFSTSMSDAKSKANSADQEGLKAADVAAEGMDYRGEPIVLKDPPDENFSLYTNVSSEWQARVVTPTSGSHELNGTTHRAQVTIDSLVATRQNVQSVPQISRLQRPTFTRRQPGQNPSRASDSLTQQNRGILDILLVIDNSGSMNDEIKTVRNNLSSLLTEISNSNWQIAMVKSEPHNSCVVKGGITSATSSYSKIYEQLLTFELQGGTEHMLKKARWALEGKSGTQCDGSWLRSGSTVAVIIVSDEKHQCPNNGVCSMSAYSNFIDAFGHDVKTYGFIPTRGREAWNSNQQAIFDRYGSITGDYSKTLQEISANVQMNLKDIFTLSAVPDGKSMTVKVNNVVVPSCSNALTSNCYEVVSAASGSAVQFLDYKPPLGADIVIDYTYGSIAFQTEWTLTYDPLRDADKMTVTVSKADGTSTELVRGTDYTLVGKVLRVTSASVVPQGATLQVDYLENTALQTVFTLDDDTGRLPSGAKLAPNTVRIKISDGDGNTVKTINSGFSFDGTKLTFTDSSQVPAAGTAGTVSAQQFTIAYDYHYGIKTSYSFSEHSDHRPDSTLSCHNETQNNQVDCTHNNSTNIVSFTDTSQFAVDDVIVITEQLRQQGNNFSLFGTGWIQDEAVELTLTDEGITCIVLPNFITNEIVMLETMTAGDCSFMQYLKPNEEREINYLYRVYAPEDEDFLQMDKDFFTNHRGKYKFEYWEVLIDGTRTNKFNVEEDYSLVFDKEVELGKNSTVGITVYLYHAL